MRIESLKAFVSVADLGSFHAAAKMLNITQPALSRRIQKLEEFLNVQLIDRDHRTFRLTAPGIYFLERARRIVADAETVIADMRQSKMRRGGIIRIACIPSIGMKLLPDVIARFEEKYPRVALFIRDVNAVRVNELVQDGEADIGITIRVNDHPQLEFTPIFTEPLGIICNKDHPLADVPHVTWSDLEEYPMAFNVQQSANWVLIQRQLGALAEKPNWFHQVDSILGGIMLVQKGRTVGALPPSLIEALGLPNLVFKKISEPEVFREIALVTRSGYLQADYQREFVDLLKARSSPSVEVSEKSSRLT